MATLLQKKARHVRAFFHPVIGLTSNPCCDSMQTGPAGPANIKEDGMTPYLWFGVALRAIGAWTIVSGLELGVSGFNIVRGLSGATEYMAWAYFNQLIAHVAIGLVLIRFAPMLAQWAYPRSRTSAIEEENAEA